MGSPTVLTLDVRGLGGPDVGPMYYPDLDGAVKPPNSARYWQLKDRDDSSSVRAGGVTASQSLRRHDPPLWV